MALLDYAHDPYGGSKDNDIAAKVPREAPDQRTVSGAGGACTLLDQMHPREKKPRQQKVCSMPVPHIFCDNSTPPQLKNSPQRLVILESGMSPLGKIDLPKSRRAPVNDETATLTRCLSSSLTLLDMRFMVCFAEYLALT
mmetsp:Transcript_50847/g.76025  ORF Transcript_50847/g.76025 Transcript_50847/m.76025 type:complete len:140 (+) Transcript_50847:56-475(+)